MGRQQSQASVKPLPQSTDVGNEKGSWWVFFVIVVFLLPS